MATSTPQSSEPQQFYMVFEDTIVAAERVLRIPNGPREALTLAARLRDLRRTHKGTWPMSVKAGSEAMKIVEAALAEVEKSEDYTDSNAWATAEELGIFLEGNFYSFYDEGEVNPMGVLIRGSDTINVYKESEMFECDALYEQETSWNFQEAQEAAAFKSDMLPHPSVRTESWYRKRDAALAELREYPIDYLDVDMGKITPFAGTPKANDQPTSNAAPTVNQDPVATPNTFAVSQIDVNHQVVLKSGDSQATIDMGPLNITPPQTELINATKEIWASMVEKGLTDRISLQDVVELAKKAVGKA